MKPKFRFKPPKWWECQWRRITCGKDSCRLCGSINKRRRYHLAKGEDPDSMESVFSDVSSSFIETLELLKKQSEKLGVNLADMEDVEENEPPDYSSNPIFQRVEKWHKGIAKLGLEAEDAFLAWRHSDAGKDLLWYPSMLVVKLRRQLDNLWELSNGHEYIDMDIEYTAYILRESITILKKALVELSSLRTPQKIDFTLYLNELENIEPDILKLK